MVLAAVSKEDQAHEKNNFLLGKLGFWCIACDIALENVLVPTWANPADAPPRNKAINNWSLQKLPHPPTAVVALGHALAKMDLLREPLSAAAHTACEHVLGSRSFSS